MTSPVKNKVPIHILFPDQDTEDEERMDFLFADFPLNPNLNKEQYYSKMNLWRNAIKNFCNATNTSIVCFNDVASVKFGGKTSLALGTCWKQQMQSKRLVSLSNFKAYLGQSWTYWTVDKTILAPFKWMGSAFFSNAKDSWKNEKFVDMEVFNEKTETVINILKKKLISSTNSLLIPFYDLAELCVDVLPNEEEFELALAYLQSKNMLSVDELQDGSKIVKFCTSPGWSRPKITKEEFAKIDLEKSLKVVQSEISRLSSKIDTLTKEAIVCGKAGNKRKAFRCLKLKHITEKDLDAKLNVESNVEKLLSQIEDNKSLSLVINAMKNSAEVIKSSNVKIEDVDKTMDEIEDVIEHDQTIQDAMGAMNKRFMENAGIFDDDLEAELELLAQEEENAQKTGLANGTKTQNSPPKRKLDSISESSVAIDTDFSSVQDSGIGKRTDDLLTGGGDGVEQIESPRTKLRRATESRFAVPA